MSARDSQVGGDHYATREHQPWDVLEERLGREGFRAYLLGSAINYLLRVKSDEVEDVKKAIHTLERWIELS